MKRRGVWVAVAVIMGLMAACTGLAPVQPAVPPAPEAQLDCLEGESQPIVEQIAAQYDVPYERVTEWVCEGESVDDILLALETSRLTQRSVEELLAMREEAAGWDSVWEEVGLLVD